MEAVAAPADAIVAPAPRSLHDIARNGTSDEVAAVFALYGEHEAMKELPGSQQLAAHCFGVDSKVETAMAIVSAAPEALMSPTNRGSLPLHHAVYQSAPADIVALLLELAPAAACVRNKFGFMPAHLVGDRTPDGVGELMAGAGGEEVLLAKGNTGDTPLHRAVWLRCRPSVVAAYLAAAPAAATTVGEYGYLPLHCLRSGCSTEVAEMLLAAAPEAASAKSEHGNLAMHTAVQYGAPAAVLQMLIDVNSEALRTHNNIGFMPAHYIGRGLSVEAAALVADSYPQALKELSEAGSLPLHRSVCNGASADVVVALVERFPEAVQLPGEHGFYPLHCVGRQSTFAVAELLLHAYPEAPRHETGAGSLPLHTAVLQGAPIDVQQLFLEALPEAASFKNHRGFTPLHCLTAKSTLASLELLLAAHPEGAMDVSADGHYPVHRAIMQGAPADVIARLVEVAADVLDAPDCVGQLVLHHVNKQTDLSTVKLLLKHAPHTAGARAFTGFLPLHVAVQRGLPPSHMKAILGAAPLAAVTGDGDGKSPLHGLPPAVGLALLNEARWLSAAPMVQWSMERAKELECEQLPKEVMHLVILFVFGV
eukprot:PLAT16183.2.p1 GENE.PLAT16183.2~~PLAT16183.2.p1  ORF type:complete len:614 (+),score=210.71 PLAT16183.2:62-1843(+)